MASTEAVQVQIAIPKFKDISTKNISSFVKYPTVPLKSWLKYAIQMSLFSFKLQKTLFEYRNQKRSPGIIQYNSENKKTFQIK